MHITAHNTEDLHRLRDHASHTRNAMQRDCYRAVLLALEGHSAPIIMDKLGRSRHFVQRWVYAYRDGGIEALRPKRQSGRPPTLPREQEERFKERILAGPTDADEVCSLRGQEALQILEKEFGVHYTLGGVYDLLHRLGLVCLKPRPRHRKNDPQVMQQWLEEAPLLSTPSNKNTPTKRSRSGSKMKPGSDSKAP